MPKKSKKNEPKSEYEKYINGEMGLLPPYRYITPTKIIKIDNNNLLGKYF